MIPVLTKFDIEMSNLASVRPCVASVRHCVSAHYKDNGSFAIMASPCLCGPNLVHQGYIYRTKSQCGVSASLHCVGASLDQNGRAQHVKVSYLSSANLYESNDTGFDQI